MLALLHALRQNGKDKLTFGLTAQFDLTLELSQLLQLVPAKRC
jgi:hypothetical protein